jgi:glyoxylase I family protein
MTMLLNVVHHVAIIVSDYEKSREFYVEKLELPIIRENYREERDDYKLDLQVGDIDKGHATGVESEQEDVAG